MLDLERLEDPFQFAQQFAAQFGKVELGESNEVLAVQLQNGLHVALALDPEGKMYIAAVGKGDVEAPIPPAEMSQVLGILGNIPLPVVTEKP